MSWLHDDYATVQARKAKRVWEEMTPAQRTNAWNAEFLNADGSRKYPLTTKPNAFERYVGAFFKFIGKLILWLIILAFVGAGLLMLGSLPPLPPLVLEIAAGVVIGGLVLRAL
jgi:hypothetical protein